MPVIRIDLPEGTPQATKAVVRDGVKAAVLRTLAPKETKYDYVAIREAFGAIGDGLPLLEINLHPGREPERKQALVDAIADLLQAEMGVARTDLYVLFCETPASEHYTGGKPLPAWVPADRQPVRC
jgi:phenylpyruvate tautomerase PptA (4-oxalocrotonate tautomerase family)